MLKLAYNNNSSTSMPRHAMTSSLTEMYEPDSSRLDGFVASNTGFSPHSSSSALPDAASSLDFRQQKQRRRSLGMKSPGRKRAEICLTGLKDAPLQVPHRYASPAPQRNQASQQDRSSIESNRHQKLLLKDSTHSQGSWAPPKDPTAKRSAASRSLDIPPPPQTDEESPRFRQSLNDPSSPVKPLRKPSPNKRSASKRSLSVPPPPPSNEVSPRFQQALDDAAGVPWRHRPIINEKSAETVGVNPEIRQCDGGAACNL